MYTYTTPYTIAVPLAPGHYRAIGRRTKRQWLLEYWPADCPREWHISEDRVRGEALEPAATLRDALADLDEIERRHVGH